MWNPNRLPAPVFDYTWDRRRLELDLAWCQQHPEERDVAVRIFLESARASGLTRINVWPFPGCGWKVIVCAERETT